MQSLHIPIYTMRSEGIITSYENFVQQADSTLISNDTQNYPTSSNINVIGQDEHTETTFVRESEGCMLDNNTDENLHDIQNITSRMEEPAMENRSENILNSTYHNPMSSNFSLSSDLSSTHVDDSMTADMIDDIENDVAPQSVTDSTSHSENLSQVPQLDEAVGGFINSINNLEINRLKSYPDTLLYSRSSSLAKKGFYYDGNQMARCQFCYGMIDVNSDMVFEQHLCQQQRDNVALPEDTTNFRYESNRLLSFLRVGWHKQVIIIN